MNLIMCLATVVFRLTLQADLHLDMPDMSGMSESDKAIYWPSGSGGAMLEPSTEDGWFYGDYYDEDDLYYYDEDDLLADESVAAQR
jgi:hypothetical protein